MSETGVPFLRSYLGIGGGSSGDEPLPDDAYGHPSDKANPAVEPSPEEINEALALKPPFTLEEFLKFVEQASGEQLANTFTGDDDESLDSLDGFLAITPTDKYLDWVKAASEAQVAYYGSPLLAKEYGSLVKEVAAEYENWKTSASISGLLKVGDYSLTAKNVPNKKIGVGKIRSLRSCRSCISSRSRKN